MTLEIIGAGFGRTGTESMKRALEILGYGPCHHMYEVLERKGRYDTWLRILKGEAEPDWPRLLEGYRSSVDWPVAHYWRELAELYPEAKILLTVRDAESWYASMDKTILALIRDPENNRMAEALGARVFGAAADDRAHVIQTYEENNAAVRAAFGPERLLVFELGGGWEPLCAFLGCAVPEVPFPAGNEAGGFHARDEALTARRAVAPD